MRPPRWPRFGRLLVVLLIMLDSWKRLILGTDSRQVDVSMLIIETLVLLLILLEVGWASKDRWVAWRARKQHKNAVSERLNGLSAVEVHVLSALALHGTQPTGESARSTVSSTDSLTRPLALVEWNDPTGRWIIAREHKEIIIDWAKKRGGE